MDLAGNLQMLRRRMNLSQEELAEKCQVSRQAITKWESGESIPTLDKLMFLADLFQLSLDELVGRISKYDTVKAYLKELAAKDIPVDENDEACAIIGRYLRFTERIGLSGEDRFQGLNEIFLSVY